MSDLLFECTETSSDSLVESSCTEPGERELCEPGSRLIRRPLGWAFTPADVLRLVRDDAHPVALCGAWAGGSDVVSAEPLAVRAAPGSLSEILDHPLSGAGPADPDNDDAVAFGGGWIGYLGYSAGDEALPSVGPRKLPAWWFGYYDHVLRRDRATGDWYFEALWSPGRSAALERRLTELIRRAAAARAVPDQFAPAAYQLGSFRLLPGPQGHQSAVRKAVEYIRKGDIFQANITLRAQARFSGDPIDAFCQGVTTLDPPYAAFVGVSAPALSNHPAMQRSAVVSLSPELFVRREGGTVISKPIKGTARRADDPAEAASQRAELEASSKNRAENVMIVDLVRNDLSRVCEPGSVTVPVLLGPEPHPGVWHLVSTVTGTLSPGATDGDLIRAAFPPGSVTGAPKVRALEIIDELETGPREAYTGAIGFRSPAAGLELNVAIRTFEFASEGEEGVVWLGAGGGIVADSDPAAEYAECLIKATPLLNAIGATLDTASPAAATKANPGADLAALAPRPTAGVFSSLLVSDGETRDLDRHLDRLAESVRDLYDKDLPAELGDALACCLVTRPTGRLRITVRPVGGPLQAMVEVVPLTGSSVSGSSVTGPPAAVTLRPVTVPGGLGAHKYRDRRLLAELAWRARLVQDEHLLLIDETGEVLETDKASVFAVIDGVLVTPPDDGRILPGTTRAAVLRVARDLGLSVSGQPVRLDDLAQASEVFVTNAVIGIAPVRGIAAATRPGRPGPFTAMLTAALAERPADTRARRETALIPEIAGASRERTRVTSRGRTAGGPVSAGGRPLVVLIDNYDSFTWNLAHLLETAGAHVEVIRNDEVTAGQVVEADPAGVVISPGPCAPAEAGISIAAVTACADAGVPLLGICLGHQAIGAAYGADIVAAPRPVHGKTYPVTHEGQGFLAGLPSPFQATRYHSLVIDEATLPADLLVTARTEGIPMAVRHRTRPIEGVQFHPESILTTHGAAIVANFTKASRTWAGRP